MGTCMTSEFGSLPVPPEICVGNQLVHSGFKSTDKEQIEAFNKQKIPSHSNKCFGT